MLWFMIALIPVVALIVGFAAAHPSTIIELGNPAVLDRDDPAASANSISSTSNAFALLEAQVVRSGSRPAEAPDRESEAAVHPGLAQIAISSLPAPSLRFGDPVVNWRWE